MEAVESASGERLLFSKTEFKDLSSGLPVCVLSVAAPGRASCMQLLGLLLMSVAAVAVPCSTTWQDGKLLPLVAVCLGILSLLSLLLILSLHPVKETVVAARHVGLHVRRERWGGLKQTQFIPHLVINNVIIHEAITMHRVIFYLTVLTHTQGGHDGGAVKMSDLKSVPLFEEFKLRLSTLREVYHAVRTTLAMDSATSDCSKTPKP